MCSETGFSFPFYSWSYLQPSFQGIFWLEKSLWHFCTWWGRGVGQSPPSAHDAKCSGRHPANRIVTEQSVSVSLISPKYLLKLKPLHWLQFSSICKNTLGRERGWQLTSGFSPQRVTYLTLTRCCVSARLSPPRSVGKRQKKYTECLLRSALSPPLFLFLSFPFLFFFFSPGPDIQVPEEEYTSLESEIKSGIHILCKCTLLKAGIKKGFGIIILESLIV